MLCASEPFIDHHLGGHKLCPCGREPIERRILIALTLGARGIDHHTHIELVIEQIKRRLQHAHMRLKAQEHNLIFFRSWHLLFLQMLGQAARIALHGSVFHGRSQDLNQALFTG